MMFQLHVVASDRLFYEGPCSSLVVPTNEGLVGILANHSNMIAALIPGVIEFEAPDMERQVASIANGLLKIENNDVLILVDTIERPEEIDENRAKEAMARAKEEMLQKKSIREYQMAQAHLSRALSRLKVKQH